MPPVPGKRPVGGLAPQPAPVDTQCLEQLRTEHDIPVPASPAAPDRNDHPLAVDIADLQMCHFCTTCAGGLERHQAEWDEGRLCCIDQTCDYFRTEDLRQVQHLLRVWRLGNAPTLF
jgi:hypothetical protein